MHCAHLQRARVERGEARAQGAELRFGHEVRLVEHEHVRAFHLRDEELANAARVLWGRAEPALSQPVRRAEVEGEALRVDDGDESVETREVRE